METLLDSMKTNHTRWVKTTRAKVKHGSQAIYTKLLNKKKGKNAYTVCEELKWAKYLYVPVPVRATT